MKVPILASKASKRMKNPADCKVTTLQKEFPSPQVEKTDPSGNYLTPQSIVDCGWVVTPPPWLNPNVIADIVILKSQIEKDHVLLLEHEKVITLLLNERVEMRKEIQELKLHLEANAEEEDIWEINKKEISRMEKMFNLPLVSEEPIEEKIAKMNGFLKKYTENDPDPVELLISMRYHG
jgi:hypothetical protein